MIDNKCTFCGRSLPDAALVTQDEMTNHGQHTHTRTHTRTHTYHVTPGVGLPISSRPRVAGLEKFHQIVFTYIRSPVSQKHKVTTARTKRGGTELWYVTLFSLASCPHTHTHARTHTRTHINVGARVELRCHVTYYKQVVD